ncbi:hypothetical protein V8C86DRAFT_2672816 [Haematococcus lacustris]
MGKQRTKDRGYLTTNEWKYEWGGYKDKSRAPFKRLPFNCCAIAFTPFEDPVCTAEGTVYDVTNIVPFVMKYKQHPVTGEPLALKDLTKLTFHKNGEGQYCCPVTGKVFTEHTHIAAVKVTGNVYAYEAIDELCAKAKNWKDLLTDEPFTRKDIIHIQDPLNLQNKAVEQFSHVQKGLVLDDEDEGAAEKASALRNVTEDMKRTLNALQTSESKAAFEAGGGGKRAEAQRLLATAHAVAANKAAGGSKAKDATQQAASGTGTDPAPTAGDWRLRAPEREAGPIARFRPGAATWDTENYMNEEGKAVLRQEEARQKMVEEAGIRGPAAAAALSAAAAAAKAGGPKQPTPKERYEAAGHVKYKESFTSTGDMSRSFTSTYAAINTKATRQLVRIDRNPTKKAYVRLHTSLGDLNLELHCDITPRTCENFIGLAAMGYYDATIFHRSIKNFMVQGGDPTGTGKGGESIYGPTFKDEVDSRLTHNGRGVLSMANSGPATNGSQFFIAYKSCHHLDFKHTVFGRVVGGLDVLTAIERVETDVDDRPVQEIRITGVTVFTNPYQEMEDAEKAEAAAQAKQAAKEAGEVALAAEHQTGKWFSAPSGADTPKTTGAVGKYLQLQGVSRAVEGPRVPPAQPAQAGSAAAQEATEGATLGAKSSGRALPAHDMPPPAVKKAKVAGGFGSFDAW